MTETVARAGRFLLSSAVLTGPGTYRYDYVSVARARAWLANPLPYVSAIGYEMTADAMHTLLRVDRPAVQRRAVKLQIGDEALIFRLKLRVTDSNLKMLAFNERWVMDNSEIGVVTRLA